MIGPLGRLGAAATLRQHCPQMTQRRCKSSARACHPTAPLQYRSLSAPLHVQIGSMTIHNIATLLALFALMSCNFGPNDGPAAASTTCGRNLLTGFHYSAARPDVIHATYSGPCKWEGLQHSEFVGYVQSREKVIRWNNMHHFIGEIICIILAK